MGAVWELFSKIERDGKKAAKCNLCLVELSGHLAGNAKKHLRIRHGIATHEDAAEVQRKPNTLKQRLRELEAQRTALLEAVRGHNSEAVTKDFVLLETHTRAARSEKLDPVQHRNHNKEATKRWRQRLACLNQLEKEVGHSL
ncbi:hypothetical protein AAVH_25851 [Aphelenchoides avenae]|nr:hypothetical protein AAVH_25851 [Aphelenchus avenae]